MDSDDDGFSDSSEVSVGTDPRMQTLHLLNCHRFSSVLVDGSNVTVTVLEPVGGTHHWNGA